MGSESSRARTVRKTDPLFLTSLLESITVGVHLIARAIAEICPLLDSNETKESRRHRSCQSRPKEFALYGLVQSTK
jgi:hypothetical protein